MKKKALTVSQLNHYIAALFSEEEFLSGLIVRGELSNVKYHSSGHIYFTLKDENSVLPCVMFRSSAESGLKFRMKDGDSVLVTGRVAVYEDGGKYQLYAETIELFGEGELYRRFEELKNALMEEGMFAEEYKQPIPKYALNIGVVTAPTGAVIHDIINNARRRNPYISITLMPVKVQGEGAAEEIADGIARLDVLGLDVIIVARGGGSIEDLFAFNEEIVARQIFASKTPIVTGIGHEPDFTIADFVADKRASTPTAAAELTVFSYEEFLSDLENMAWVLKDSILGKIKTTKNNLSAYKERIEKRSPKRRIYNLYEQIEEKHERIKRSFSRNLRSVKDRMVSLSQRIESASPVKRLISGYSYVTDESGRNIKTTKGIKTGDIVDVRLYSGSFSAQVKEIKDNEEE